MLDNSGFEMLSTLATGAELGPESLTPFFEMAVLCDLDETSIFGDEDWSEDLDDADVDLTPELVEAMLETEAGRAMFIEGMTEDGELTADQAECMLDNLDFVALAGISSGDEPDPRDPQRLVQRRRDLRPGRGVPCRLSLERSAPTQFRSNGSHELLSSAAYPVRDLNPCYHLERVAS